MYISWLYASLSRVFQQYETHKQTQKAGYRDHLVGQITRGILSLTRLVGRVVETTDVVRLFKRTINWTPTKPAQAMLQWGPIMF